MKQQNKINKIIYNNKYRCYLDKIKKCEVNRKFCRHDLKHFLDVARIAYIINLEKGFNLDKDLVYAIGLLHDIGRWMEYDKGIPHHIASAELCIDILIECGFNKREIDIIKSCILSHRKANLLDKNNSIEDLFYYVDKISRNCFACEAVQECNWEEGKKNLNIIY